jgi:hypothetical protein
VGGRWSGRVVRTARKRQKAGRNGCWGAGSLYRGESQIFAKAARTAEKPERGQAPVPVSGGSQSARAAGFVAPLLCQASTSRAIRPRDSACTAGPRTVPSIFLLTRLGHPMRCVTAVASRRAVPLSHCFSRASAVARNDYRGRRWKGDAHAIAAVRINFSLPRRTLEPH